MEGEPNASSYDQSSLPNFSVRLERVVSPTPEDISQLLGLGVGARKGAGKGWLAS